MKGVIVVDRATNAVTARMPLDGWSSYFAELFVTSDGQQLYISGQDGVIEVFSTTTNTLIRTIEGRLLSAISRLSPSPDGANAYVATGLFTEHGPGAAIGLLSLARGLLVVNLVPIRRPSGLRLHVDRSESTRRTIW